MKQIAILAGTALLILAAIYQLYHVIARYRLRKVRFDFTVCLEGVAEHTPIALYDKKGKKALRRNGKAYQELTDQTGQELVGAVWFEEKKEAIQDLEDK
ncbi:hypothetical protein P7H73_12755 [Enterococcus lactis]|nr:hypothetical protein [Enterococcus faecium]MDT2804920.1 hypothetical protein [Enterococcus lactis]